jgi:tetratricopeptide (TPR) repeat protein
VGFSHERLKQVSRTIDGKELKWSAASSYWTRKGLHFIFSQPFAWLKLEAHKLLLFVSNYEVPNDYYPETARYSSAVLKLSFVNFGMVLALGLAGMVFAWPIRRQTLPAYLFVAAFLFSSLLFYVLSRLRAPVIPFLLMFAGYGLSEVVESVRNKETSRAMPGVFAAVLVFACANLLPVKKQDYSAQAWTQTGNVLLNERKPGPAIDALNRALALEPSGYSARYSLVMALAGMGRVADAEAEYGSLVQAAGSSTEGQALVRLAAARIAIAHRDFPTAAGLYHAALSQDPTDSETSYMLGLVYISMDSLAQARDWLQRAITLDPAHDAARSALQAVEARLH